MAMLMKTGRQESDMIIKNRHSIFLDPGLCVTAMTDGEQPDETRTHTCSNMVGSERGFIFNNLMLFLAKPLHHHDEKISG